jgi:hypothetical protein
MGPSELWAMLSAVLGVVAHNRGRDPRFREGGEYSVWHVLRVVLCCLVHGMSIPTFYVRRDRVRGFLRQYGLPNRTVSQSQLYKRLRSGTSLRALLELLRQSASRALKALGSQEVRVLPMDLTNLESDQWRDSLGAWGFSSTGGFYGYKLGLITSTSGVVLGMTLMRANWTEMTVDCKLLRMARETILSAFGKLDVDVVVADSGFDGESIYRGSRRLLKAPLLCPRKRKRNPKAKNAALVLRNALRRSPQRERDQQLWKTLRYRELYRRRTIIEQINGQLKHTLRIDEIPVRRRGVRRLGLLCLAKLVIYNCALNVNIRKGEEIRRIAALVAA